MINRKSELLSIIKDYGEKTEIEARQLVDEIVFVEEQLIEVKKYPFLSVNPSNKLQQKATPAAKQYKELLQQYNNCLRLLFKLVGDLGEAEDESPLRKWAKSRQL